MLAVGRRGLIGEAEAPVAVTANAETNMQTSWELEVAEDQLGNAVRRDVLPRTA